MTDSKWAPDLEELKQLFDLVVHSMDFGSGFLETDDVSLLRRIAVQIGVDPMVGTPDEFRTQYPHPFKPYESGGFVGPCCHWCGRLDGAHPHQSNAGEAS